MRIGTREITRDSPCHWFLQPSLSGPVQLWAIRVGSSELLAELGHFRRRYWPRFLIKVDLDPVFDGEALGEPFEGPGDARPVQEVLGRDADDLLVGGIEMVLDG